MAVIAGGYCNRATAAQSLIVNGFDNCATGSTSTVLNGNRSCAKGNSSVSVGGDYNTACGNFSIVGGCQNVARGNFSAIIGGHSSNVCATHTGSSVIGTEINTVSADMLHARTLFLSAAQLPTTDPGVAGVVWRDGTDLKISV